MEITKQQDADTMDVQVRGRLDAAWADHLSTELSDLVRAGSHRIRLDLSELDYVSSAGIRVLIKWRNRLAELGGAFVVANPSKPVLDLLKMTHLDKVLMTEQVAPTPREAPKEAQQVETDVARFEIHELERDAALECEVLGEPELLPGATYGEGQSAKTEFPAASFGLGIGAFGSDFGDCRSRFGEFLAVAGAAAYMPTDGTTVPDFMVATGTLIPDLQVLSGLRCTGHFSHLVRFDSVQPDGAVGVSHLAEQALEVVGNGASGLVILAETSGLVGASLRRPPTAPVPETIFSHPDVRKWLSFTSERAFADSLCLAAGVVARDDASSLTPLLRPLSAQTAVLAHLHALAMSYCHVQQGKIDLHKTVSSLFETEALRGLLHLLTDDRPIVGVGESEFARGAMWCGAIT